MYMCVKKLVAGIHLLTSAGLAYFGIAFISVDSEVEPTVLFYAAMHDVRYFTMMVYGVQLHPQDIYIRSIS